jgi:hypothetical protein
MLVTPVDPSLGCLNECVPLVCIQVDIVLPGPAVVTLRAQRHCLQCFDRDLGAVQWFVGEDGGGDLQVLQRSDPLQQLLEVLEVVGLLERVGL